MLFGKGGKSLVRLVPVLVAVLVAGCDTSGRKDPLERCYEAHFTCRSCCDLLSGMLRVKCEESCDCTLECCKEEAGVAHLGTCQTCRAAHELFICDFDKAMDKDGDGYNWYEGDCDDTNPNIGPHMPEIPGDGVDNNCNGWTDEDIDGDGFREVDGDCDDFDPTVYPGAPVVCGDGKDNNCNGFIDEEEPDMDGDGFGPCEGDCNDGDPRIGPGSIEVVGDGVDNNCNGLTDEPREGCDCIDPLEGTVGFAEAIEICNPFFVREVETYGEPEQIAIFQNFGAIYPRTAYTHDATDLLDDNCNAIMLCSGVALDTEPDSGTSFFNTDPHPLGESHSANDMAQIIFHLRIPMNVEAISFDFMFLSSEYPQWVCTQFNDTFLAILEDPAVNGGEPTNISFDEHGKEITVNNNFFENPNEWSEDLSGTGYDVPHSPYCSGSSSQTCTLPDPCPPPNSTIGSGTGWLRTYSPVTPGSHSTLTFSIHDEGDHILDSCVIIDNFRWIPTPVDGPGTVK